jgi:hypothetical protein
MVQGQYRQKVNKTPISINKPCMVVLSIVTATWKALVGGSWLEATLGEKNHMTLSLIKTPKLKQKQKRLETWLK